VFSSSKRARATPTRREARILERSRRRDRLLPGNVSSEIDGRIAKKISPNAPARLFRSARRRIGCCARRRTQRTPFLPDPTSRPLEWTSRPLEWTSHRRDPRSAPRAPRSAPLAPRSDPRAPGSHPQNFSSNLRNKPSNPRLTRCSPEKNEMPAPRCALREGGGGDRNRVG
jgi:hypothetical protein